MFSSPFSIVQNVSFCSFIIKLINISLNNHQHDTADSKSEPKSNPSFSIQIALNRAIDSISIIAFFALQSSIIIIILMPQRIMLYSVFVVFFSQSDGWIVSFFSLALLEGAPLMETIILLIYPP